jgi:hypothetical protein
MRNLIGVGDEQTFTRLKRWLLLVDKVAVVHQKDGDWDFRRKNPSLAADLDWLTEEGIVFRVNTNLDSTINVRSIRKEGNRVVLVPESGPATIYIRPGSSITKAPMTVSAMIDAVQDIVCRLECQSLRESSDIDTISLRTPSPRVVAPKSTRLVQGMVQHVVINAIPEPSESTPLERILEFRNDPEAKAKLHALRRWMAKVAKTQIPSREIADELEWLLHEYEAYMRVSRMKFKKGFLKL